MYVNSHFDQKNKIFIKNIYLFENPELEKKIIGMII